MNASEAAALLGKKTSPRKAASSRLNGKLGGYLARVPGLIDRSVSAEDQFGRWAVRLPRKSFPVALVPGNVALALVKAGVADFEAPVDREAALKHLEELTQQ